MVVHKSTCFLSSIEVVISAATWWYILLPMQLYILILLILVLVQLEVEVLLESTTVQVYYWRGVGGVHLFCGQPA